MAVTRCVGGDALRCRCACDCAWVRRRLPLLERGRGSCVRGRGDALRARRRSASRAARTACSFSSRARTYSVGSKRPGEGLREKARPRSRTDARCPRDRRSAARTAHSRTVIHERRTQSQIDRRTVHVHTDGRVQQPGLTDIRATGTQTQPQMHTRA